MRELRDLLRPGKLTGGYDDLPAVMAGTLVDLDPVRVTVPAIDGGKFALRAFGKLPDPAEPDDDVRVMLDQFGGLVIVAWEPHA